MQPTCNNGSQIIIFISYHSTPENTEVRDTHVTCFILTIYAPTYEESKIMYSRNMNAPHGSSCYVSRFPHGYTSKKISKFRFVRFTSTTPLWKFASGGKIL